MIDEDLLRESHGSKPSSNQEINPYIQQRSHSMFLQSNSNREDLIDLKQPGLEGGRKKTKGQGRRRARG